MPGNENKKRNFEDPKPRVLPKSLFPMFDEDNNLLDKNGKMVITDPHNKKNIDPITGLTKDHFYQII